MMNSSKKEGLIVLLLTLLFAICFVLPTPATALTGFPLWGPSIQKTTFEIFTVGTQCGPTDNETCISCHDLMENAPDPNILQISEPTHGSGVYRLSPSEYLSVKMHTYSKYIKPKCTACHFNSKISKEELKGFRYAKLGDRLCYTCHQDKAPPQYQDAEMLQASAPKKNPILQELKDKFFSQRPSVLAYRKRMKLD